MNGKDTIEEHQEGQGRTGTTGPVTVGNFSYINPQDRLLEKATRIAEIGFVGGGLAKFEQAGRAQLISLLQVCVYPDSRVLDVGCGCLRGGYWLIHFLSAGCYFGIEPNKAVLQAGCDILLAPDLMETKKPRFDTNEDFDFSVFNVDFDFIVARSIWTHATKNQIKRMLDGFIAHSTPDGVFLTSVLLACDEGGKEDYQGQYWVGKSHQSDKRGTVAHSYEWIAGQCRNRSLFVKELTLAEHGKQKWLLVSKQEI